MRTLGGRLVSAQSLFVLSLTFPTIYRHACSDFDFEKGAYKSDLFFKSASTLFASAANLNAGACLSEFREFLYRFYHNEMALRYDDVALVVSSLRNV